MEVAPLAQDASTRAEGRVGLSALERAVAGWHLLAYIHYYYGLVKRGCQHMVGTGGDVRLWLPPMPASAEICKAKQTKQKINHSEPSLWARKELLRKQ